MSIMYQPAVNLTKPIGPGEFSKNTHRSHLGARTKKTEEDSGPAEPTRGFVPVLEHLEHGCHLSAGIDCLVLDDDEFILRRAVYLDNAVERVGRIGRDDVEPRPILVQDELVAGETRGSGGRRHAHRGVRRFRLLLLLLLG